MEYTTREHRLLKKGILGNVGNVVGGSINEHISQPIRDGDPVRAIVGVPVAALDAILTAPDAALAGIAGQDIEKLSPDSGSRTKRDIGVIAHQTLGAVGNLLTLKPGQAFMNVARAGLGVLRLSGDVPMDFIDAAGGYDGSNRRKAQSSGPFSLSA
jgi:hypothetical protein